jgi:hypothetical protein
MTVLYFDFWTSQEKSLFDRTLCRINRNREHEHEISLKELYALKCFYVIELLNGMNQRPEEESNPYKRRLKSKDSREVRNGIFLKSKDGHLVLSLFLSLSLSLSLSDLCMT